MDRNMEKLYRNALYNLLNTPTKDGYVMSVQIDGVNNSEVCLQICNELEKNGCLTNGSVSGRNKITGKINKEKILKEISRFKNG